MVPFYFPFLCVVCVLFPFSTLAWHHPYQFALIFQPCLGLQLFHFLLLLCFAPLLLFISLLVFTHLMVSLGPVPVISHDLEVLPVATDPPLSPCLTSPSGLKSFTATDNEMFYDFSMFTPSPLLPSSPVLPLSRLALWQGQRQNYAHFQIHLNTRNCCCYSGAWHAFKICSLQNVCPHRDRDGDRDRKREGEREGDRETTFLGAGFAYKFLAFY